MRTASTLLKASLAISFVVTALLSVAATSYNIEPMVLQKTYIFKTEETIFTGTVVTNDLKARTLTINGHNPLRRETVEKLVPRGTAIKEGEKPQVKDAVQVFWVDPFCRVALTNKPTARPADVPCGAWVDVDIRKMSDGTMVANAIRTADKHPYDPPPAKAPSKKK